MNQMKFHNNLYKIIHTELMNNKIDKVLMFIATIYVIELLQIKKI